MVPVPVTTASPYGRDFSMPNAWGAVTDELVEFDERAVVEQQFDALAGGLLALGVLLLDRLLATGRHPPRGSGPSGRRAFPAVVDRSGAPSSAVGGVVSAVTSFTLPFTVAVPLVVPHKIGACGNVGWRMQLPVSQALASRLEFLEECGSTNTELVSRAADAWPHLSVVATASQTAGRGRLDRVWVAPPEGRHWRCRCSLRPSFGRWSPTVGFR
jgi:hypothetical protein